jgi:hypothetical protein
MRSFARSGLIIAPTLLTLFTLLGSHLAHADEGVALEKLQECQRLATDTAQLNCFRQLTQHAAQPVKPDDIVLRHSQAAHYQDPSYLTVSSGLRLPSDKSNSNLLYEAQLVKNIPVTAILPSRRWWIDAPVRINLRQFSAESKPVRTPTFNPGVRLTIAPEDSNQYYTLGLHHYSNGQEDDSTDKNGNVNLTSGSFNTNYFEVTANRLYPSSKAWGQIGLRQHFYGTFEPFQREQYPRRQLLLGLQSKDYQLFGRSVQIRLAETIGLGYKYRVKNEIDPSKNLETRFSDRFNTRLEIIGKPFLASELRLYLRYDYGFDYYNVHFQQRLNRFQIGVAALGGKE